MKNFLTIKTPEKTFEIQEGKPVRVIWKAKNKTRSGRCDGIGWLVRGEKPHSYLLVSQCFQTWDTIEREYVQKWTIWPSQIHDIRVLA